MHCIRCGKSLIKKKSLSEKLLFLLKSYVCCGCSSSVTPNTPSHFICDMCKDYINYKYAKHTESFRI